MMYCNFS